MRWIAEIAQSPVSHAVIEHDEIAGFYVYAYQDGYLIADYLQDTFEIAKRFAHEKFHVPQTAWTSVEGAYRWASNQSNELNYMIVHDLVMGFQLIIYKNGSRINDTTDRIYWKNSLEEMIQFAQKEYGITPDSWHAL